MKKDNRNRGQETGDRIIETCPGSRVPGPDFGSSAHITHSPSETFAVAKKVAATLKPGDVLALVGELGAGKTCFVQGLASSLGVPEKMYVRSPSFTLMNEYQGGDLNIYHFDFYRLVLKEELADLGLDEYFEGNGITIVEWADKFPLSLPVKTKYIYFKIIDENTREISFLPHPNLPLTKGKENIKEASEG